MYSSKLEKRHNITYHFAGVIHLFEEISEIDILRKTAKLIFPMR
jgi:hypothetical protein